MITTKKQIAIGLFTAACTMAAYISLAQPQNGHLDSQAGGATSAQGHEKHFAANSKGL